MGLAGVEFIFTIPLGCINMYLDLVGNPVQPYVNWASAHADFSTVYQYPVAVWQATTVSTATVEMSRYFLIICAVVFFAFFGFADEARRNYRLAYESVAKRVGLSTGSISSTGTWTANGYVTLNLYILTLSHLTDILFSPSQHRPRHVVQQPLCHHARLHHATNGEEAEFVRVVFVAHVVAGCWGCVGGREEVRVAVLAYGDDVGIDVEGVAAQVSRGLDVAYAPRGNARYGRAASIRAWHAPRCLSGVRRLHTPSKKIDSFLFFFPNPHRLSFQCVLWSSPVISVLLANLPLSLFFVLARWDTPTLLDCETSEPSYHYCYVCILWGIDSVASLTAILYWNQSCFDLRMGWG